MRLFAKDPLNRKLDASAKSYREDSSAIKADDLEKPF